MSKYIVDEIIIGIDPGKSGGIAVWDNEDGMGAYKMPATEKDVWDLICDCSDFFEGDRNGRKVFAYIEHVHSMPGQGVASMFKFGMNYGMLRAFLIAADIPFETATPSVWQRSMKCLTKGDKNITKARAQELWPELKITHAVSEALLICEYGRRKRVGETDAD